MKAKDSIIADIADRSCHRIARTAIRNLQKMKDCLSSGDDSCLKNVWDEICVQEQMEESIFWNAYETTIKKMVTNMIQGLDYNVKAAIWLQTEAGINFEFDNPDSARINYAEDDIACYIISNYIMPRAMDWNNSRIEKYKEMY
jgi:hypothetical protein